MAKERTIGNWSNALACVEVTGVNGKRRIITGSTTGDAKFIAYAGQNIDELLRYCEELERKLDDRI